MKHLYNLISYFTLIEHNSTIDLNKCFDKISLSKADSDNQNLIEKTWNKGGFCQVFKRLYFNFNFDLPTYVYSITFLSNDNKKIITLQSEEKLHTAQKFRNIKLSKKNKRLIGYSTEWKEWIDLVDYLDPLYFMQDRNGVRFRTIIKDFENLIPQNFFNLPIGLTYNDLIKRTSESKNFRIFPSLEDKLKKLSIKDCYSEMLKYNDKVWLNHNIVCILFDKFISSFREAYQTNTENTRSLYFVINGYARRFGLFPTIDRLVLSYWIIDSNIKRKKLLCFNLSSNVKQIFPKGTAIL